MMDEIKYTKAYKQGLRHIVLLMAEGYELLLTSYGPALFKTREGERFVADVSYKQLESLKYLGLVIFNSEANAQENPYEDHHDIHYKLATDYDLEKV